MFHKGFNLKHLLEYFVKEHCKRPSGGARKPHGPIHAKVKTGQHLGENFKKGKGLKGTEGSKDPKLWHTRPNRKTYPKRKG